ncbi:MAG: glycosyltransferase family 2 protein [Candidatus Omnitrophota bacterium]
MKTCILMPSYNESRTIGGIVSEIKQMGFQVFVVDDGSIDDTGKIAADSGAIVMRHNKNLGKGASLKEGFNFILRTTNFDNVIIMDGDGQHNPKDIEKFVSYAEKNGSGIIMGNRMTFTRDMPLIRLATNRFVSWLLSIVCRQNIPDTQCGFRLIGRKVLEKLTLESNKFDLESEMLIKASRKKIKIDSVPIDTIYRNEDSRIHPLKDTFRFIILLIKSYFV